MLPRLTNEYMSDVEVECADGTLKTHMLALCSVSDYVHALLSWNVPSTVRIDFPRHILLYILNVLFYRCNRHDGDDHTIKCVEYVDVINCAEFLAINKDAVHKIFRSIYLNCNCDADHAELKDLIVKYLDIINMQYIHTSLYKKIIAVMDTQDLLKLVDSDYISCVILTPAQCWALFEAGLNINTCSDPDQYVTKLLQYPDVKFGQVVFTIDKNCIKEYEMHIIRSRCYDYLKRVPDFPLKHAKKIKYLIGDATALRTYRDNLRIEQLSTIVEKS